MIDIVDWLSALGLAQYAAAFVDNDIDGEVLGDLTDDDLKDLGVSLGHRKKLQRAIAALKTGEVGGAVRLDPATASAPAAAIPAVREAERRHLTVMFCDMAGSTALAGRLDPEDYREVLRNYQVACSNVVARYEGTVAQYLGDGILVYFGYPHAHEDDAERAVRSALGIVRAVRDIDNGLGAPIEVRVGIATGIVVVGDMIGEGVSQEQAVAGETPNLAARLQSLAESNTVVISASTRGLIGRQFQYEYLGLHRLKGFADEVEVWQVKDEQSVATRFGATHADCLTRLVGRDHEVDLLRERWSRAQAGEGQLVLLSGEAGIGKSRIAATLGDHLAATEHFAIRYQCSPHHVNSPLHPVIQQLENVAGITGEDGAEEKLFKLRRWLEKSAAPPETLRLMAMLLSIPTTGHFEALALSANELKQKTLKALIGLFERLATQRPTLFVLEDAHWVDATTRELMDLLIERSSSLQALILVTHRPEFTAPWSAYAHSTVLTLNRLGRNGCQMIVQEITKGRSLPSEVFEQIVVRTDGIPLFVEELTKAVLESGQLAVVEGAYVLAKPLAPLSIPATLQDSLMARLDKLREAKEIAQIGAAIGREFPHALIEAVSTVKGKPLDDCLEALQDSEIVFRRGLPPEATYVFKHALIQDTAYDSLLRSRRQQIHQRIASAMEARFPHLVENQPELLAHHFARAGALGQAAPLWLLAGQRAVARSANQEAISDLQHCLDVLRQLPDGAIPANLELDAQISLGSAWIALRGYSARETEAAYLTARKLLEGSVEDPRRVPVLHGLSMVYVNRAEHRRMLGVGEELLNGGTSNPDTLARLVGHRVLAVGMNFTGRFADARFHAEAAAALYDEDLHRDTAQHFGHDMGVGAWCHLAIACTFLGDLPAATQAEAAAARLMRQLDSINTRLYGALWDSFTRIVLEDFAGAESVAELMINDAAGRSMALWVAFGRQLRGSALVAQDQHQAGLDEIRRGRQEAGQLSNVMLKLMSLRFEAEALIALVRFEEAGACLEEAERHVATTGEGWWWPELHRLRAESARRDGRATEDCEACLTRAMEIAGGQESRLFELRSAVALGRLWQSSGRRGEISGLITPLLDRFSRECRSVDVARAEALLRAAEQDASA